MERRTIPFSKRSPFVLKEKLSELPDLTLIEKALEGELECFNVLYQRYSDRVYNRCFQFTKEADTAQDLTQDIFVKVYLNLDRFQGRSRFSAWLYAVTYNHCVEYHRKLKRNPETVSQSFPHPEYEGIKEALERESKAGWLNEAMRNLSPPDQRILHLKYWKCLSIREIQRQLNLSESAVKMRLSRARYRTRDWLEEIKY